MCSRVSHKFSKIGISRLAGWGRGSEKWTTKNRGKIIMSCGEIGTKSF